MPRSCTGSIVGSVSDGSGASLPGATVTIEQAETKLTRELVTDATGVYHFTAVPSGTYTISVKMNGFRDPPRRRFLVDGKVTIDEAGLTGDINFDTGLLAAMTARRSLDLTEERNPLLERVRFNVDVDTATPILVDNNLAHAEIDVDLRVLGTPYETGLSGRLTVLEGGEITLNERRYEVERGVITFIDERRIVPSFDLLLNTTAGNYDITLARHRDAGRDRDHADLGAVAARARHHGAAGHRPHARRDARRGIRGRPGAGAVVSRRPRRLDARPRHRASHRPQRSAHRAEPDRQRGRSRAPASRSARSSPTTSSWSTPPTSPTATIRSGSAEYDVTRRFQTRAVRQSDNSYRFDFRHDVRFGGTPEPRRLPRQRPTVDAPSTVTGDRRARRAPSCASCFDVEGGRRVRLLRRARRRRAHRGALGSAATCSRGCGSSARSTDTAVRLTLRVTAGPRVDLQFEGATPARRTCARRSARKWHRGVFDAQRVDDGVEALRAWLMRRQPPAAEGGRQISDVDAGQRRRGRVPG